MLFFIYICLNQTHGRYHKGNRITQEHENG